ncbi:FadR family transcriptional regulator [Thalassotalea sp. HSM 43]|uniref:FadR/GntR family transcriptional regulator n=1 Tax=Thalassotalea sp. HSM 43 TaxID=2552945 RepID=UPI00108140F8|nr:FadR/GntR family transcriptional regulator [Thalassotalea sp. HSM 43]QBY04267.1 FadR family transcriptional regulator [Thalassotalea sp. HSM 43]
MAQKHNLTYQLTHDLGKAIVTGQYKPGDGLPTEAELCEQFDVSRSATREAVKMLSAKGLIASRPKKGIHVLSETNWNMFDPDVLEWILSSNPSLQLLKSFTEVRAAIEPQAAALASTNATFEQLEMIEKALERMKAAEQGLDDILDSDIEFHTSVLRASGNPFIVQLTDFIATALKVSIRYTNAAKGESGDVEKHAYILDTIKSRNPVKAHDAVKEILDESLALIEKNLN